MCELLMSPDNWQLIVVHMLSTLLACSVIRSSSPPQALVQLCKAALSVPVCQSQDCM